MLLKESVSIQVGTVFERNYFFLSFPFPFNLCFLFPFKHTLHMTLRLVVHPASSSVHFDGCGTEAASDLCKLRDPEKNQRIWLLRELQLGIGVSCEILQVVRSRSQLF